MILSFCFSCNSIPRSVCLALHGVKLNFKQTKTWLVPKLHEQQNSSFGLIKFIWLCWLEREYFASFRNQTRIHTQTIKKNTDPIFAIRTKKPKFKEPKKIE